MFTSEDTQQKVFENPIERRQRKNHLSRFLFSWFFSIDTDTLEKLNILRKLFFVFAISYYGSSVLKLPPPYYSNHFIVLKVWMWSFLFLLAIGVQLYGRYKNSLFIRARGALLGLVFCGAILEPLYSKKSFPDIDFFAYLVTFFEIILWSRLSQECRLLHKVVSNSLDLNKEISG